MKGKKLNMNKLWLFVPAFFDLLTSGMQYIAFNFISASAYQIFKGGTIITTFLFSITFLKQPITKKQIFGSLFALFGIIIVGLANIIFSTSSSHSDNTVIYIYIIVFIIYWLCTNDHIIIYKWFFLCI
jgi:drug/metabolite transporter (DMT)-like permease